MIIRLNENRFNKIFLFESTNSKRAHRQTREFIAKFYGKTVDDPQIIAYEKEIEKRFFGEGRKVDWFIVLEPNIAMWLFEYPGSDLNTFLDYIFAKAKKLESPAEYIAQIRPITTFEKLREFIIPQMEEDKAKEKEAQSKMEVNLNQNYQVLGPLSFEEANKYGNYTGLDGGSIESSRVCYTQYEDTWLSSNYSDNNRNSLFLLLRKDWKKVPAEHDGSETNNGLGELSNFNAYDNYGLSMIFVWITPDSGLHESNTRWNHKARYPGGVDQPFTELDISKLMGAPFNKVFNIKTVDEKNLEINEIIERRLANGELPNSIFEDTGDQYGNNLLVKFNEKWNMLNVETKKIVLPIWFNYVEEPLGNDLISVSLNGKNNVLDLKNGRYIWNRPFNEWFDVATLDNERKSNYFIVKYKDLGYNLLGADGELLWHGQKWFDSIKDWAKLGNKRNFCIVTVKLGNGNYGYNLLTINGELLFKDWLDEYDVTYGNYAKIGKNEKYNIVEPDCSLVWDRPYEEWFDYIEYGPFREEQEYTVVGMRLKREGENPQSKYNILKKDGTLLWTKPLEKWFKSINGEDLDYFSKHCEYCRVYNDKMNLNLINTKGELVWPYDDWFTTMDSPNRWGVEIVTRGHKYNVLIGCQKRLASDEWFDEGFYTNKYIVLKNDNGKYITVNGRGDVDYTHAEDLMPF